MGDSAQGLNKGWRATVARSHSAYFSAQAPSARAGSRFLQNDCHLLPAPGGLAAEALPGSSAPGNAQVRPGLAGRAP